MANKLMLLGVAFYLFLIPRIVCAQSALSVRLEPSQYGPYAVGFRSHVMLDYTRPPLPDEATAGRKMVVYIWYPTRAGLKPMRVVDYLKNSYAKIGIAQPSQDTLIEESIKDFGFTGKESSPPAAILQAVTNAYEDAEPLPAIKGVIIYSPGAGDSGYDNFLLCEVLASEGYVVASSPSIGFSQRTTTPTAKNLEVAARDLETVLGYVRASQPQAATAKVGLMGYSWGGLAAMLVQMRDPRVIGVVSIDGSVASHQDKAEQTAWFDVRAMRVPYLFYSAFDTLEKHNRFLEQVHYAPVSHVHLGKMHHTDFQSFNYVISKFQRDSASTDDARSGYEAVVKGAAAFFGWCFRRTQEDLQAFVFPIEGQSRGYSVTTRNAFPSPPSEAVFLELVRRRGANQAHQVLDEFRSHDPGLLVFSMQALAQVGFSIFDEGKHQEGIDVLKLVVDSFPRNYAPHGYLGSLYEDSGDAQAALTQYAMALGMAVNDTHEDPIQVKNDIVLFNSLIEKISKAHRPN